jgi:hypothetical protein
VDGTFVRFFINSIMAERKRYGVAEAPFRFTAVEQEWQNSYLRAPSSASEGQTRHANDVEGPPFWYSKNDL